MECELVDAVGGGSWVGIVVGEKVFFVREVGDVMGWCWFG